MRFRHWALRAGLALVALALIGSPALAQETTGSVEGTVIDSSGAPVPGAAVKIEGGAVNRTGSSDMRGRYLLAELPPGTYKVSATLAGFGPGVAERVQVAIGKAVTVNFSLKVGGMAEEVTVTGELVGIDTATTTIQTNVTASTIQSLPKGTQMGDLLKLAPAARAEASSGQYQVDGASGSENSFMIDGLEVGNFRTGTLNTNNNLPFALIAEMQVKTSGFNAEFGGATGGVISVVTKSGTNEFRGAVGLEFAPSSLQGDPREALNKFRSGSGASTIQINEYLPYKKDDYKQYYPVFALGGPVKQDKAWFFVSYSPQRYTGTRTTEYYTTDPRTRKLNATQAYDRTTTGQYLQGRLDVQASNSLRLSAGYVWNPYTEEGVYPHNQINLGGSIPSVNFGGTTGVLTGNTLTSQQGGKQDGHNFSMNATWTPNNRIIGNAKVARGYLNEMLNSEMIPQATRFRCVGSAPPSSAGCSVGFDTLPSGNSQRFKDASVRWIGDASLAFFVDDLAGRHEFKTGYQFSKVTNDVDSGYVPYGRVDLYYSYTMNDLTGRDDPVTPGSIGAGQLIRFGTIGEASNTAHSIYLQDTWRPTSRLTINAGVRLEKEDLPSFNGYAPPISFGFTDKWVPRLGVAYDITGDGRTKAFASFNRFQDRLKFELPRGSFGGDFYRVDYFEIMPNNPSYSYYTLERILGNNKDVLGGVCPINNPTGGLTRCQYDYRIASNDPNATIYTGAVDPDMKPFTQTEYSAGLERELMKNVQLSLRYTHKQVDWAIEDAGFPTADGSEAYIIGNPGTGLHAQTAKQFGYAKTTKPERLYDALEVKLDRRFADNFSLSLAYTYSKLRGNYSGLASSDELTNGVGRTSPGVNRFFDLPHLGFTAAGTPDNGPLASDRPHVFNAFGAYDLKWGGSQTSHFSFFTTAQSGVPRTGFYTLYAASVLYGRNDLGRTPMFSNTDLMLSHEIRFGRRQSLTFEINLLNAFDQKSELGFVDNPGIVNPSISTLKLPSSVTNEPEALNYVLTNGIVSNYNAFLNDPANPQRKDTALGMATVFQGSRAIRLSVRFGF
jgi:hypothetical protein